MKFLFSLLSFFLIPTFCYAQITIEEKVEIDPQIIQSYSPTQTHTIQLDLQWDTPQYDVTIVGVVVPCQSAGAEWQNGGTISLTIDDAMAGLYRLQPRFNTPSGVTTNVTYQLYFDGSLIIEGTRAVPGGYHGTFPYFNIEYTPPLVSNFSFNLNNNVSCILTYTSMAILKYDDCSTGYSWNGNTEPVNLSFTSGGEFASFYNGNQQMIGDNFSGTFSEFQDIVIRQDSVYRDTADKYFIVQCEWGGMIKTDSVKLLNQTGDVIVVEPDGADDTLYIGEEISFDIYPNDFGGGCFISFPFELTYSAEILTGNEYGNLLEPYTGIPVQSFTGLWPSWWWARFDYVADGISPDVLDSVIIRVSTSDPSIPYTDFTLYIKPPPIYVYTEPEVVGAADTANVIIKKRNADGTLEDFPPEQTFELAVLDGCVNGNFMVGTDINVYFAEAQQPIKFVTADSLDSDSGYVRLRVGTDVGGFMRPISNIKGEEEKQLSEEQRELVGNTSYTRSELRAGFKKMIAEKKAEMLAKKKEGGKPPLEAPIVAACYIEESTFEFYWEGDAKYEDDKTIEILLGETKYFQAKYVGALLDKLIIEEVTEPELIGGLEIDVWHENPVAIVEGDKIGVYWETEKPIWDGDVNGTSLKKGLIRLIGKHWEPGKKFRVKLTAKNGPDLTEIEIEVKKPVKITSSDYTISKYKTDVFGEVFNLDSLTFIFAGEYGILPQIIKAQMMWESSFKPGYRYEPFPDVRGVQTDYRYTDNRYKIINETNEGTPPIPSNHSNVYPQYYWGFQNTIWEFFYAHSSTLNVNISFGAPLDIYPRKNSKGHYVWFEWPAKKWKEIFDQKYEEKIEEEISPEIAIDSALAAANYWLQNVYKSGRMNTGIAQTRMSSSYGFLQMTYYKALEEYGYTENDENYPEKINEIDSGTNLSLKTLVGYLNEELGSNGSFDTTDWEKGFEIVFRYGLSRYNGKRNNNYGLFYLNESRKFTIE